MLANESAPSSAIRAVASISDSSGRSSQRPVRARHRREQRRPAFRQVLQRDRRARGPTGRSSIATTGAFSERRGARARGIPPRAALFKNTCLRIGAGSKRGSRQSARETIGRLTVRLGPAARAETLRGLALLGEGYVLRRATARGPGASMPKKGGNQSVAIRWRVRRRVPGPGPFCQPPRWPERPLDAAGLSGRIRPRRNPGGRRASRSTSLGGHIRHRPTSPVVALSHRAAPERPTCAAAHADRGY
jgi:hypothetical protein